MKMATQDKEIKNLQLSPGQADRLQSEFEKDKSTVMPKDMGFCLVFA